VHVQKVDHADDHPCGPPAGEQSLDVVLDAVAKEVDKVAEAGRAAARRDEATCGQASC